MQRDSSCARAPLRTPPPGRRADAMLRIARWGLVCGGRVERRVRAASKVSLWIMVILGWLRGFMGVVELVSFVVVAGGEDGRFSISEVESALSG